MPPAVRYKHLARYREIATVLFDEGFGYILDELDLARFLRAADRLRRREQPPAPQPSLAERTRRSLERLGPTFVKIGQILSTRPDLLPEDFEVELSKLQDQVPPVPFEVAAAVVEEELGGPISEMYLRFDPEPLAAASIGQVHAATLYTGEEVVVKVQRPDIERVIATDLDILLTQAQFVERNTVWGRDYNISAIAEEVGHVLRSELDYLAEGRNCERFRANFAGDESVAFPEVHWNLTTRRVITLERFRGVKLNDMRELTDAGFDRKALAQRFVRAYFKMIFEDGFFHADPHPGNVLVLEGGRVGFTDFGRVGTVSPQLREEFSDFFLAVVNRDARDVVDGLLEIGVAPEHVNESRLESEAQRLFSRYYGSDLRDLHVATVIEDVLRVVRQYHLRIPPEISVLLATVMVLEGVAYELDPTFNFIETARPFAQEMVAQRLTPKSVFRRATQFGRRTARLLMDLPESLSKLLRQTNEGNLKVEVGVSGLDRYFDELREMVNRLGFAVLVSSFVIGLSYLLQKETLPRWTVTLFAITLIAAALCGAWFFVSIFLSMFQAWRKRRLR